MMQTPSGASIRKKMADNHVEKTTGKNTSPPVRSIRLGTGERAMPEPTAIYPEKIIITGWDVPLWELDE